MIMAGHREFNCEFGSDCMHIYVKWPICLQSFANLAKFLIFPRFIKIVEKREVEMHQKNYLGRTETSSKISS